MATLGIRLYPSRMSIAAAPSVFGNVVTVNGGAAGPCLATPARRHAWGQLKTLYR